MLIRFQFSQVFQGLIYDPRCGLSWRMLHVHLRKKVCSLLLGGMSYKYQLTLYGLLCHWKLVCLVIFCLDDVSTGISGELKSPNTNCAMVDFHMVGNHMDLWSFLLWLLVFALCIEVLLFLCITICNCFTFLDWIFDHYVLSFLTSLIIFILKSILSDMSIATPAFFWFPFAWNIFFHLSLSACMCP